MKDRLAGLSHSIRTSFHQHRDADEYNRRFQILRSLLLVFTIIAAVIMIIRQTMLPDDTSYTALFISSGFIVIGVLYTVTRSRNYYLTMVFVLIFGNAIIIVNAVTASPPHIEIAYVLIIPLLSTVMFSLLETIAISIVTFGITLIFVVTIGDISRNVMFDLVAFTTVVLVFIVFAAFERDRLEKERQNLVVKKRQVEILRQFLSNVSHDLKTPITIINTSLYLLKKKDCTAYQLEKLERIQHQTQHLAKLIQDMLTMSRLDTADSPSSMEWLNLNESIYQVLAVLSSAAEAKHITLDFNAFTEINEILANRDNVYRMFTNLIENAVTYTSEGGQVLIETRQSTTHISIKIRDTGIGISPTDLPYIFDRFYRADKARSTHTGGAGLGLAIVKRTVELYGGTITVDSIENQGTTFFVLLPLNKIGNRVSKIA